MATVKQIQDWVRGKYDFVPQSCWIAHVKSDLGLPVRVAANRRSADHREKPCPDNKRQPIEVALRHFQMI